jgi:hypothetical protein
MHASCAELSATFTTAQALNTNYCDAERGADLQVRLYECVCIYFGCHRAIVLTSSISQFGLQTMTTPKHTYQSSFIILGNCLLNALHTARCHICSTIQHNVSGKISCAG